MRIVIHVKSHNSWEPVPRDVEVTPHDVEAGKVKPGAAGGFVMKVPRAGETHVECQLTESTLIGQIIREYTDKNKQAIILTRAEAVANYLASDIVPHWTNRKHMRHIEIYDDGPSEELFRAMLQPHLEADHGRAAGKNIDAEDVEEMVKAYLEPLATEYDEHHHVEGSAHAHGLGVHAHLHRHFKLKVGAPDTAKLAARKAERDAAVAEGVRLRAEEAKAATEAAKTAKESA